MKLVISKNIWSDSVEFISKEGFFTKELIIIALLFILVIVELSTFLILIKNLYEGKRDYSIVGVIAIFMVVGIFLLVFLSTPAKLFLIGASKVERVLKLGWIKSFIFRKNEFLSFDIIKMINLFIFTTKNEYKIRMEIEKINGKKINVFFTFDLVDSTESILNIFLNLAKIIEFKSYSVYSYSFGYKVKFNKTLEEKRLINENKNLIIESEKFTFDRDQIKIPYLVIKELGPDRIVIYKKASFPDILRFSIITIIFPFILILAFLSKDPYKYVSIILCLFAYLFVLYVMRRFLSPMETVIDNIRGLIMVRKLLFSVKFPIYRVTQLEISDQLLKRSGTFIFHLDARLSNKEKRQLFYSEFVNKNEKVYEVYENILKLGELISRVLKIPFVDNTKFLKMI
ncbi:MAG: hypothetical protein RMI30_07945 [Thermodesulfovibrio sp.]|nr:hypothetical protein [Thermodesulfovibrio sp.]MDW7999352.1 hypothetical protein [Thermodesulfovibrio sp.]